MKKQPPIVVGIDFSDSSPILMRHAIHAARASDAEVVAVHVLDQGIREYRKASGLANPEFGVLASAAEDRFADLVADIDGEAKVEFIVKAGKPAVELDLLVKELGASFLIVSANDMEKKRLGSIAARCVRIVACDVLILRDWQGGDFQNIVACTDFSNTSGRALVRAISTAKQSSAQLEIVHVMYPPNRDSWGKVMDHAADSPQAYEEKCKAAVAATMDRFLAKHQEALKDVKFKTTILESEMPSMKITGHVRDRGADLVVMGTHGNSGFTRYFIGTNAERLLHDAPVSVFAVR